MHAVVAAQTRSLVAVHAAVMYCPLPHTSLEPVQTRSAVAVPACDWNSLARVEAHGLGQLVRMASAAHTEYAVHDGPVALTPYVTGARLWYVATPHAANVAHVRSSCSPLEPKLDSN
jgi:hypothetical protein